MTAGEHINPELRLIDYWDNLLAGLATLPQLEEEMSAAVRYLHEHDDASAPSQEFVRRLRAKFEQPANSLHGSGAAGTDVTGAALVAPPLPRIDRFPEDRANRRRAIFQIAAGLLIFAALATILAGRDRLTSYVSDDDRPPPTPTVQIVVAPTPEPATPDPESTPVTDEDSRSVPMYLHNPARKGNAAAVGPRGVPEVAWTVEAALDFVGSPIIGDGILFAGSADGHLYAVDADSGEVRWRFETAGPIRTSSVVTVDHVIVAGAAVGKGGAVHGLDRITGVEVWRFDVGDQVTSDLLEVGGIVYFGCDDGFVYALRSDTGEEVWRFDAGSPASFAVAETAGTLVFGVADNRLIALDAASGSERWTFEVDPLWLTDSPSIITGHEWSAPVIVDGQVFVSYFIFTNRNVAQHQLVFSINLTSGEERWMRDDIQALPPSLLMPIGETLYAISGEGPMLHALNPATGADLNDPTTLEGARGISANAGAIAGNDLYLYSTFQINSSSTSEGTSRLLVFDLRDGSSKASIDLGGPGEFSGGGLPLIIDGWIYLSISDGRLVGMRDPVGSAATEPTSLASMYLANPARTGNPDAVGPDTVPEVVWTFKTGLTVAGSPVMADGTIYLGSADSYLYALDAVTGDEQWRFETAGAIRSTAVVDGDQVIVAGANTAREGAVHAIDRATGQERWQTPIGDAVTSHPTLVDGIMYFGCDDGFVYALDAETGNVRWIYDTSGRVMRAVAVAEDLVVAASSTGSLVALDARTGQRIWSLTPSPADFTDSPERVAGFDWSTPVILDGAVYVTYAATSQQVIIPQGVYAIDLESGNVLWERDDMAPWSLSLLVPAGGQIFAMGRLSPGSAAFILTAFDPISGEQTLEPVQLAGSAEISTGGPTVAGEHLYVVSGLGKLLAYDLDSGQQWTEISLPVTPDRSWFQSFASPPLVVNGWIYLGASDGSIIGLRASPDPP